MRRLVIVLSCLLWLGSAIPVTATTRLTPDQAHILYLIRKVRGIYPSNLYVDYYLMRAARTRAYEISYNFCHCDSPASPYRYGEVIGWWITDSPNLLVKAWMQSYTHRRVILGHWNRIGIATTWRNGIWYVAVVFGLRQ